MPYCNYTWISNARGYEKITKDEFVRRCYMRDGEYPYHYLEDMTIGEFIPYREKIWNDVPKDWYRTWMVCYDNPKRNSIFM